MAQAWDAATQGQGQVGNSCGFRAKPSRIPRDLAHLSTSFPGETTADGGERCQAGGDGREGADQGMMMRVRERKRVTRRSGGGLDWMVGLGPSGRGKPAKIKMSAGRVQHHAGTGVVPPGHYRVVSTLNLRTQNHR